MAEPEEEEDKGTFQDIGQGLGAGAVNIAQGVVELGALGVDAALDTDTSRSVTDFFEETKDYLNFTPTGAAGKVAEGVVTYGSAAIPIVGWLGRANAVARGSKVVPGVSKFAQSAERFGASKAGQVFLGDRVRLAGTTALATGAADVLVSPSTFNTIADSFDVFPDFLETEKDVGLMGSDEAFRRFRNKFRFGVEGTMLAGAAEVAFPVIGAASRLPAKVPGAASVARLMSNGFDELGRRLTGGTLQKYFTAQGLLPRELYEGTQDVRGVIDSATREAGKRFIAYEKAVKNHVKKSKLFGKGREGIEKSYNDTYTYLTEKNAVFKEGDVEKSFEQVYGKDVKLAADAMRQQVDGLTDVFMKSIEDIPDNVLSSNQKRSLTSQFAKNQGTYLRRMYEIHLTPEKFLGKPDEKLYERAVGEVSDYLIKFPGVTPANVREQAEKVVNDQLYKNVTEGGETNLTKALSETTAGLEKGAKAVRSRDGKPMFNIADRMLKSRVGAIDASPTLRGLMGEVKDVKEVYLRTVGDMAETVAANQFYRNVHQASLNGDDAARALLNGGRPVIDGRSLSTAEIKQMQARTDYKQLGDILTDKEIKEATLAERGFGGKYGALTGSFVPIEVADALTIAARAQGPLEEALAISLQAKGLSQVAKTVYNPLSQIRNFHSGIFMVGANGNIRRDMNLMESSRLTVGRIADMNDKEFAEKFNMLQRAGIVDQNYVVNEYRELLKEGADLKIAGKASDISTKLLNSLPFAQSLHKGAQNVYSGTDNFWKTVGYSAEKAKYTNAIRRGIGETGTTLDDIADEFVRTGLATRRQDTTGSMSFLDTFSTDLVKATMPTYSRVPEVIKQIRRIPFVGNFMAFPAEILRTTTNITRQGLREMSFRVDPSSALYTKLGPEGVKRLEREIRGIGANRLSSYAAMAYVTPLAIQKVSMELTGFDESDKGGPSAEEKLAALERMAPYFMSGNTLAIMKDEKTKDGIPNIEYVDLSYMMPYDFMVAPVRAALQAYQQKGEVTDSELRQIASAMGAAFNKFTEPFASESLLAERIADVTVRNGVTKTGAKIFIDKEDPLDRVQKGITHVLGGFTPGAVEMFLRERRGELEAGRVTKAITGDPGRYGEEFTPASEFASTLTGFREMRPDLGTKFYYKGSEYTSARSDLSGAFRSYAKRNDVTPSDIAKRYAELNADLKRAQADLYADIQAAKTLGLNDSQIIRQLSERSNLGKEEIGMIMNNMFRPIPISEQLLEQIYSETVVEGQKRVTPGEDFPLDQVMETYSKQITTPLKPEAAAPVTPKQVQQKERTILGTASNPISALRDLQIFQSTRD
tara:strand:- start:12 stop:3986 length:3975 start_codon:yes stop_codon:yes gene_type:complete